MKYWTAVFTTQHGWANSFTRLFAPQVSIPSRRSAHSFCTGHTSESSRLRGSQGRSLISAICRRGIEASLGNTNKWVWRYVRKTIYKTTRGWAWLAPYLGHLCPRQKERPACSGASHWCTLVFRIVQEHSLQGWCAEGGQREEKSEGAFFLSPGEEGIQDSYYSDPVKKITTYAQSLTIITMIIVLAWVSVSRKAGKCCHFSHFCPSCLHLPTVLGVTLVDLNLYPRRWNGQLCHTHTPPSCPRSDGTESVHFSRSTRPVCLLLCGHHSVAAPTPASSRQAAGSHHVLETFLWHGTVSPRAEIIQPEWELSTGMASPGLKAFCVCPFDGQAPWTPEPRSQKESQRGRRMAAYSSGLELKTHMRKEVKFARENNTNYTDRRPGMLHSAWFMARGPAGGVWPTFLILLLEFFIFDLISVAEVRAQR